jgi:DNA-directed RNA polymerase specialized sigma24 family protein
MPKTQRLSDAALVRRSQQGDRRAFGALVSRYDRRLRGLAYALLLDREQMDAALGLAYMRSWRDVLRIKPRDDIGPWLYRAVYNACIDQLRRNETPSGNRRAPVEVPPGAPGGLRAVLGTLVPADRVAVVLVEREGFSATSAARILGVTPDELETRLDIVRDRLAPYVPEPAAADAVSGNGAEGQAGQPEEGEPDDGPPDDGEPDDGQADDGQADDGQADADAAHVEAPANGDTPSADVPSPDPQLPAADGAPDPTAPADPAPASAEDEVPAPAQAAAKANGHAANRGRGRRARRRANGAERQAAGPATPTATPAGETDETEPANGDAASATADPSAGDDGSAHPAAAAPSTGEHRAADR